MDIFSETFELCIEKESKYYKNMNEMVNKSISESDYCDQVQIKENNDFTQGFLKGLDFALTEYKLIKRNLENGLSR
jgi:hypothetical protein